MRTPFFALLLSCACATTTASGPSGSPTTDSSGSAAGTAPAVGSPGAGAGRAEADAAARAQQSNGPAATAVIEGRSGSHLTGSARFVSVQGGLAVHVEVQNAVPGEHGVHIHEKGDCSDPEAKSAGAHYSPGTPAHHGGPTTHMRHAGDLGNLTVDQSGNGTLDVIVPGLSVDSLQDGVVDRAIVVHADRDDLQTDPSGKSGARIGCGRILPPTARGGM